MDRKRCAGCGGLFTPRPNVPHQRFCSNSACQHRRRAHWQRAKLKQDPDHRANQAEAQRRWRERHPHYWREYRRSHPEYSTRNREQQRQRNRRRGRPATSPMIAKMAACREEASISSGTYWLMPVNRSGIAKMDACLVKMQILSEVSLWAATRIMVPRAARQHRACPDPALAARSASPLDARAPVPLHPLSAGQPHPARADGGTSRAIAQGATGQGGGD